MVCVELGALCDCMFTHYMYVHLLCSVLLRCNIRIMHC